MRNLKQNGLIMINIQIRGNGNNYRLQSWRTDL